jgi:very-short-patch-repair endonuclease
MKIDEYKRVLKKQKKTTKPKRPRLGAKDYANNFDVILCFYGVRNFKREYLFCPGRRFRFDFAWLQSKVAIEVHGNNQHGRYYRVDKDSEKNNEAVCLGWIILVITTEQLKDPLFVAKFIKKLKILLNERKEYLYVTYTNTNKSPSVGSYQFSIIEKFTTSSAK